MAALTPVVESLDKVPEPVRSFYEQKDGKYVLALDGTPPGYVPAADLAMANGKIVEFRDNNIALTKKLAEVEPVAKAFEGIKPEDAKAALAKVTEFEKKGMKAPDDLTVVINSAVQAAIKPIQEASAKFEADAKANAERADNEAFSRLVGERFTKLGGRANAQDYVIGNARAAFVIENGAVKAKPNLFSATNPAMPLQLDEWLKSFAKDHDFAFEPSKGGGAPGSGGGNGTPPGRPGQTVLKDPTPAQLGEHMKDIATGKMRVEYSTP